MSEAMPSATTRPPTFTETRLQSRRGLPGAALALVVGWLTAFAVQALAAPSLQPSAAPPQQAAGSPGAPEAMTSAEAVKHSVLSRAAFWLIPEREGCIETITRGPGTPPQSAAAKWEANVWACRFTAEHGVARCQNLTGVTPTSRDGALLTELSFTVRPDRDPVWAATFGGLTETFVSDRETLVTNARREYLLRSDSFRREPAPAAIHRVCTGRWEPMTAKDADGLARRSKSARQVTPGAGERGRP